MWVVHGKKKTVLIIVTGGQEWLRWCAMTAVIPGSGASSNGLKHALVTSRNSRSALPPSLVPKRVDSERSGAIGVRWAALARVKWGCWITWCATVCRLTPHSGHWRAYGWKPDSAGPSKYRAAVP
jgi:hypothetical protein